MSDLHDRIEQDDEYWTVMTSGQFQRITDFVAARLVASGELVSRADLKDVKWCVQHGSKVSGDDLCEWILIEDRWNAYSVKDCRIVSAGLLLQGDEK